MSAYRIEGEFGRNRLGERLNKRVTGPRPHHAPPGFTMYPNEMDWVQFPDEQDFVYCLHVHKSGLTLTEAQSVVDQSEYHGYKVAGLRSCTSTLDKKSGPGCFIVLKRKFF